MIMRALCQGCYRWLEMIDDLAILATEAIINSLFCETNIIDYHAASTLPRLLPPAGDDRCLSATGKIRKLIVVRDQHHRWSCKHPAAGAAAGWRWSLTLFWSAAKKQNAPFWRAKEGNLWFSKLFQLSGWRGWAGCQNWVSNVFQRELIS